MNDIVEIEFVSYGESVPEALDAIGAAAALKEQTAVLIKPNLINASPFPITTAAECVEAVIRYVRSCSKAAIVIGEGCGDSNLETSEVFDRLGYRQLAGRQAVELIDLNHAPLRKLQNKSCPIMFFNVPVSCENEWALSTGTEIR